jgi:transcriptional regulator with XRE-family HTH domain
MYPIGAMAGTTIGDHEIRRRELREFLKSRREALSPALVGHAGGSRRRARGLRREEVAALADVGLTWYTWLEQGRDINVSADTLARIARALQLSPTDTTYLFSLAAIPRLEVVARSATSNPRLQAALDGYAIGPAFAVDTFFDVQEFNNLADGVFDFDGYAGPFARNHSWRIFMDPTRRSLYADWPSVAKLGVATLRVCYASHVENTYLRSLIASLIEGSEEFRHLWGQHPTAAHWPESIAFNLTPYGHLQFTSVRFRFIGQEDRYIVLLAPETPDTVAAMTQMTRDRAQSSSPHSSSW